MKKVGVPFTPAAHSADEVGAHAQQERFGLEVAAYVIRVGACVPA